MTVNKGLQRTCNELHVASLKVQSGLGELRTTSVRTGSVIAEISTGQLPNTNFKCFRLEKLTESYKYFVSRTFIRIAYCF